MWLEKSKKYISSLDSSGEEKAAYLMQNIEFDAYSFAFAVMKYKYGVISCIYVPSVYGDAFFQSVNQWCEKL